MPHIFNYLWNYENIYDYDILCVIMKIICFVIRHEGCSENSRFAIWEVTLKSLSWVNDMTWVEYGN